MILKFIKDCPTRHAPEKSYREDTDVVISDHEYGEQLITDGYAIRIDKTRKHKAKVKKMSKEVEIKKEG